MRGEVAEVRSLPTKTSLRDVPLPPNTCSREGYGKNSICKNNLGTRNTFTFYKNGHPISMLVFARVIARIQSGPQNHGPTSRGTGCSLRGQALLSQIALLLPAHATAEAVHLGPAVGYTHNRLKGPSVELLPMETLKE